ncbi:MULTISPECIES: hypothetical protein [Empedobacter]|uniref:hypothetical protein n=1 Tax=Empedobacter TaxID=59734 RepID=UPI002574C464|nr:MULTISPECIES: hypothetical protein [Empedobacter]MDM1041903.1 hypothetical protein [Empedobacter brevis]MDM1135834.1 hypothetical protein [Empedobacter sp. R750]
MRTIVCFASVLMMIFSCNNEDDSRNTIYKEKYERRFIIFQDSLGGIVQDSGVVQVSQSKNLYKFDFITSQKIDPIENIQMEMTGSNSLRNVGWTPTKLIMLSRDSINISYKEGKRYWLVNSISKN